MPWSSYQINRLGREKQILANRVTWLNVCNQTNVQVQMTSNKNRNYVLGITLQPDFPHACPELVVMAPRYLYKRDGNTLPYNSSEFHTLSNAQGLVSICHFRPNEWTNENTLYQVFMKGRLWIEAYEGHLETGYNMDFYLGHQKSTFRM